jgi:hypothetical protein
MTERMARALAAVLAGESERAMPQSRRWGVLANCSNGRFVSIEDGAGWAYKDERAYESCHQRSDPGVVLDVQEWGAGDGSEEWARKLSMLLGSEEYWHSGGGIGLVFYRRPDGRFAVIGLESGAVYGSYAEFDADNDGTLGENHLFA